MATEASIQDAVDRNYEAFRNMLPELLTSHAGDYALLRERRVAGFFGSAGEAMVAGDQRYPDQLFSIQLVTDKVVDLGFFSHAKLRGSV